MIQAVLRQSLVGAAFLAVTHGAWATDSAQLERGKTLFTSAAVPACAVCHTLADAGTSGTIGPDLDELKPGMDQIKRVLREGDGAMPSFSATMSEADMNAVAAYVVHATGGAK